MTGAGVAVAVGVDDGAGVGVRPPRGVGVRVGVLVTVRVGVEAAEASEGARYSSTAAVAAMRAAHSVSPRMTLSVGNLIDGLHFPRARRIVP